MEENAGIGRQQTAR